MRILITGAQGQLGQSLQDTAPTGITIIATDCHNLDLTDRTALRRELKDHRPDMIINAAAYTAVDKAEGDAALANRVNGEAVADIAECCIELNCRLIQISTDFVFKGDGSKPLPPDAPVGPLSVYGQSKLAGERAALKAGSLCRILRTSWVYSEHGQNFVKTMLELAGKREQLTVVNDQTGCPTYAHNLALAVWQLAAVWPDDSILHYADAGSCTWHEFATHIFSIATEHGLLQKPPEVLGISSADYGAAAPRPAYSVLDTSLTSAALGITPPAWQDGLSQMLSRLAAENG